MAQFKYVVILSDLGDLLAMRYPSLGLHFPRDEEAYNFDVQVHNVVLTHMELKGLGMWVSFHIICTFHNLTYSFLLI